MTGAMYFDVDDQVEITTSCQDVFTLATHAILERRGSVIARSSDILVFAAPFCRIWGLPRLPLGVSHGIFQAIAKDGVYLVRLRVSLLWLRVCLTAMLTLLLAAVLIPGAGRQACLLTLLLATTVAGAAIYVAAVAEARRYFKGILLKSDAKGVTE